MNTEFWKLLRQYREFNGLSQSELKDRLDTQGYPFTESAISKWENGIHVPKAEVVEVLEDILMPKSVGLLLKAAGYLYEAESRFQLEYTREEQSSQSKELQTTTLTIATNLEKYQNEPITFHGTEMDGVGEIVYGGWWLGEERARLGDVNRKLAARLLICLKKEGEFPELDNIQDWSELNDTQITVNFIHRLISREHRGNF